MEKKTRNGNNDQDSSNRKIPTELKRVVRFPVFQTNTVCPICEGRKCKVCADTGTFNLDEEWVDVQEHLVVQYLHDNLNHISMMYQHIYGNMVDVKNLGTLKKDWAAMELSIGTGQIWIVWNTTGIPAGIKIIYNKGELNKWLA